MHKNAAHILLMQQHTVLTSTNVTQQEHNWLNAYVRAGVHFTSLVSHILSVTRTFDRACGHRLVVFDDDMVQAYDRHIFWRKQNK